jgi:hypothetical protein
MRNKKTRRLAAVGVIGLSLAGTAVLAVSQAAVATAKTCTVVTDDGHWPAYVNGQPAGINPHTTAAIYMWHDRDGWHVRVTHKTHNKRSFGGQITTGGKLIGVKPVRLEKGDRFTVSPDKHTVTFFFKNYGWIDGLDFHTGCAPSLSFGFQSDGKTSPASRIVIGRHATHPASNPFVVNRELPPTTTTSGT